MSLRVLKNISRVSAATPMKYQTISLKQFFPAKGAIYYVAIATVIFSHVFTCEDIMFSRESSPSLVFI